MADPAKRRATYQDVLDAPEHQVAEIIGGGATGVELAAELYNAAASLRHYGLEVFDESRLEITLIEAGARILPALPEKLAEAAREELEALGVRVSTGAHVTEVKADGLVTAEGGFMAADLRVWAAGVKGADLLRNLAGLETNARNQLVVNETLQTSRDHRIFALGDCCACPLPGGEAFRSRMNLLDECAEQVRAVADWFDQLADQHRTLPQCVAANDAWLEQAA